MRELKLFKIKGIKKKEIYLYLIKVNKKKVTVKKLKGIKN